MMQLLMRSLICLSCLLIFSSFRPQTFWYDVSGSVHFKDVNRGSTEGLYIQIYGDGELLAESKIDNNQSFNIGFLDLHYSKVKLYWKEDRTDPFYIRDITIADFYDQSLELNLEI